MPQKRKGNNLIWGWKRRGAEEEKETEEDEEEEMEEKGGRPRKQKIDLTWDER